MHPWLGWHRLFWSIYDISVMGAHAKKPLRPEAKYHYAASLKQYSTIQSWYVRSKSNLCHCCRVTCHNIFHVCGGFNKCLRLTCIVAGRCLARCVLSITACFSSSEWTICTYMKWDNLHESSRNRCDAAIQIALYSIYYTKKSQCFLRAIHPHRHIKGSWFCFFTVLYISFTRASRPHKGLSAIGYVSFRGACCIWLDYGF